MLTDEEVAWTLSAEAAGEGITAAAYLHLRTESYTDSGAIVLTTSPGNFDLSGLADGDYTITWAASDSYVPTKTKDITVQSSSSAAISWTQPTGGQTYYGCTEISATWIVPSTDGTNFDYIISACNNDGTWSVLCLRIHQS